MPNIAVFYYSSTGNVHALAEAVASGEGLPGDAALESARRQGGRLARVAALLPTPAAA